MFRRILFFLALALLVLKVIGVIARGPSPIVMDAAGYWNLSDLVLAGDVLMLGDPIAYRTPAYPWLLALVRLISSSPLVTLVWIQAAMWMMTIMMIAHLASDITQDHRASGLVLGIATLMISSVVYIATTLTETLFVFALVAHLWSVRRFVRSPSVLGGAMVGVILGLAILTRPIAMLIWIADAIYLLVNWYWIHDPRSLHLCRTRGWICVMMAGIVTMGCVTPWLARNQFLFGKPMLTEFVGRNIWIVAFQDGSGSGYEFPATDAADELKAQLGESTWDAIEQDNSWRHTWTVSDGLTQSGLDDPSADRLMKRVAKDAIKHDPVSYCMKTIRRTFNFWRTRATDLPPQFVDAPEDQRDKFKGHLPWGIQIEPIKTALRYRLSNWLPGNTFLMLLTFAAIMILIWRVQTRAVGLWIGAILGYFSTVTAVLEIPAYRYRMIVEPIVLLAIVAAFAPLLLSKSVSQTDEVA